MVPVAIPLARVKEPMLPLLGTVAGLMVSTRATLPAGVPPLPVTPTLTATLAPWVMFSAAVEPFNVRDDVVDASEALAQLLNICEASTLPSPEASSKPLPAL